MLFPILTVVIGVVLASGSGFDILLFICGALLTADGVLGLVNALKK